MRGDEESQDELFSYGSLSQRIPLTHPLRLIRQLADEALSPLKVEFEKMYSRIGRPSIPPEQMLRALLLQMLYTVRSERMLVEQMEYNLLFRWFVGLGMNDRVWSATSFTKNRERLLSGDVARRFFTAVITSARRLRLLSDEYFTVDGTLIEAWASEKSYKEKSDPPKRGSGPNGKLQKCDTHESKTDPEARLYRKGVKTGLRLSHMAHAVSENQNGLIVATEVTVCSPREERLAAIRMIRSLSKRRQPVSIAADKSYHEHDFVDAMREMDIAAHVPRYRKNRSCLLDPALYEQPEYVTSQKRRKWIERCFNWIKNTAHLRKTRHKGLRKLDWNFALAAAAYNLVRIANLTATA
ncbi:MAG: IS5 family transposase [Acidobacteria bacterium]|nr:IS5 family transposase [Acidobacteriota bacterium]